MFIIIVILMTKQKTLVWLLFRLPQMSISQKLPHIQTTFIHNWQWWIMIFMQSEDTTQMKATDAYPTEMWKMWTAQLYYSHISEHFISRKVLEFCFCQISLCSFPFQCCFMSQKTHFGNNISTLLDTMLSVWSHLPHSFLYYLLRQSCVWSHYLLLHRCCFNFFFTSKLYPLFKDGVLYPFLNTANVRPVQVCSCPNTTAWQSSSLVQISAASSSLKTDMTHPTAEMDRGHR